tara:strand:+ start:628 stop:1182 length:555 start_codon:yes stop_codon:yes gene_type:complete
MTTLIEILPNRMNVTLSLAYATNNNFTGKKIYKRSACFLHPKASEALDKAVVLASSIGYKIKIFDAFRPSEAQKIMWDYLPDPNYISNPKSGSPHSRGIAIDITLTNFDDEELEMGTPFDSFSEKSHHGYNDLNNKEQKNRMILLGIMTAAGWDHFKNEWWHYQLFNSKNYPVLTDKAAGSFLL